MEKKILIYVKKILIAISSLVVMSFLHQLLDFALKSSKSATIKRLFSSANSWLCGVVVISTARLQPTKHEFRLCTGSNPARSVSEIYDGEDNGPGWKLG